MASCSLRMKQGRHQAAATNSGVLPPDVLFDVLLRFPAKELCRLRAVCRPWRRLTSDPLFIKAHAAHHPGPLFLASFRDDKTRVDITDSSGNLVKRIGNTHGHMVLCPGLELACVVTERNSCHVLNPATGAVYALPESPAKENVYRQHLRRPQTSFFFGRVAAAAASAAGEYKVLRMFHNPTTFTGIKQQLCEVFTINGVHGQGRWRRKQSPARLVEMSRTVFADGVLDDVRSSVVVDGVVYFLTGSSASMIGGLSSGIHPDSIASFDLDTEQWRKDLQVPVSSNFLWGGDDDPDECVIILHRVGLAELKGCLVLTHRRNRSTMDLWFLTDFDNGVWLKEYSIQAESDVLNNERFAKPLLLLDDRRIVIHLLSTGLLLIHDPATNISTELEMRNLAEVGLYTGSLLSMERGDMV